MMTLKEQKEMEDSFKKAQKPWVKILNKVDKCKLDYHNACKAERSASNQERNATGDNAVSPEQVNWFASSLVHAGLLFASYLRYTQQEKKKGRKGRKRGTDGERERERERGLLVLPDVSYRPWERCLIACRAYCSMVTTQLSFEAHAFSVQLSWSTVSGEHQVELDFNRLLVRLSWTGLTETDNF